MNLLQYCFFFYVLVFWPRGMWDLSSPTRDRTLTPCIGRQSLNHWTTREVPALLIFRSGKRLGICLCPLLVWHSSGESAAGWSRAVPDPPPTPTMDRERAQRCSWALRKDISTRRLMSPDSYLLKVCSFSAFSVTAFLIPGVLYKQDPRPGTNW